MHQCSTMLLSIVSPTACGLGANPSVALRNARSLPSCLELQLLAYKSSQKRDAAGEHIGDESISRAFSPSKSRARRINPRDGDLALLRARASRVKKPAR